MAAQAVTDGNCSAERNVELVIARHQARMGGTFRGKALLPLATREIKLVKNDFFFQFVV